MKKIIITLCIIVSLISVFAISANAEASVYQTGDMNGDGVVSSDDAIYLLRHTLNPEAYPLAGTVIEETEPVCPDHNVKKTVTDANCITVGKIEYYCDNCDYYEFEYTQTAEGKYFGDHKYEYVGYSILNTPCYTQNNDRYECVFCGDEKYEFVSKTYTHAYETFTEKNGCEVRTYDKCVNCGDIINDTTTEEHSYNASYHFTSQHMIQDITCSICNVSYKHYIAKSIPCGNTTTVIKFEGIYFVYNHKSTLIDAESFFYISKDFGSIEDKTLYQIKEEISGDILTNLIKLENGDIIIPADKEYTPSVGMIGIRLYWK